MPPGLPLRAVIVDDEPLARERLRTLLAPHAEIVVLAECGDGEEAIEAIRALAPDLVFLDVQMPEVDGFEVLEAVEGRLPAVVFVTAYDDYALRAFEVNAIDYLLKPFDRARFEKALARAAERLAAGAGAHGGERGREGGGESGGELRALLAHLRAERGYSARFVVRSGGKLHFVRADEVDWIDAQGNYVRLHVGGKAHLVRETMKGVEARLDPSRFFRVHRSAIVNVDRIAALEPYFHGEYVLTMRDGSKLTSSRTHSGRLRDLLR
jgi:two-component system LytT family response regulator